MPIPIQTVSGEKQGNEEAVGNLFAELLKLSPDERKKLPANLQRLLDEIEASDPVAKP